MHKQGCLLRQNINQQCAACLDLPQEAYIIMCLQLAINQDNQSDAVHSTLSIKFSQDCLSNFHLAVLEFVHCCTTFPDLLNNLQWNSS